MAYDWGMSTAHNRDIALIDSLVARYKRAQALETPTAAQTEERNTVLSQLLEHFADYFSKYVNILHGGELNLQNRDTYFFLSLFLTNKPSNATSLGLVRYQMTRVMQYYDRDEIHNELVIIFIKILDGYRVVHEEGYERHVDFVHYFSKVFRWRVKDFFNKLVNQPLLREPLSLSEEREDPEGNSMSLLDSLTIEKSVDEFGETSRQLEQKLELRSLDLNWVIGTKDPLFKDLTRYERGLLYSYYGLGKSVQAIADGLERDKDTVWRHLGRTIDKLRDRIRIDGESSQATAGFQGYSVQPG